MFKLILIAVLVICGTTAYLDVKFGINDGGSSNHNYDNYSNGNPGNNDNDDFGQFVEDFTAIAMMDAEECKRKEKKQQRDC